jgi:hypothetical protein
LSFEPLAFGGRQSNDLVEKRAGEGGGNPTLSRRRVHKATESLDWTIDLPVLIIMSPKPVGISLLYFYELIEIKLKERLMRHD